MIELTANKPYDEHKQDSVQDSFRLLFLSLNASKDVLHHPEEDDDDSFIMSRTYSQQQEQKTPSVNHQDPTGFQSTQRSTTALSFDDSVSTASTSSRSNESLCLSQKRGKKRWFFDDPPQHIVRNRDHHHSNHSHRVENLPLTCFRREPSDSVSPGENTDTTTYHSKAIADFIPDDERRELLHVLSDNSTHHIVSHRNSPRLGSRKEFPPPPTTTAVPASSLVFCRGCHVVISSPLCQSCCHTPPPTLEADDTTTTGCQSLQENNHKLPACVENEDGISKETPPRQIPLELKLSSSTASSAIGSVCGAFSPACHHNPISPASSSANDTATLESSPLSLSLPTFGEKSIAGCYSTPTLANYLNHSQDEYYGSQSQDEKSICSMSHLTATTTETCSSSSFTMEQYQIQVDQVSQRTEWMQKSLQELIGQAKFLVDDEEEEDENDEHDTPPSSLLTPNLFPDHHHEECPHESKMADSENKTNQQLPSLPPSILRSNRCRPEQPCSDNNLVKNGIHQRPRPPDDHQDLPVEKELAWKDCSNSNIQVMITLFWKQMADQAYISFCSVLPYELWPLWVLCHKMVSTAKKHIPSCLFSMGSVICGLITLGFLLFRLYQQQEQEQHDAYPSKHCLFSTIDHKNYGGMNPYSVPNVRQTQQQQDKWNYYDLPPAQGDLFQSL